MKHENKNFDGEKLQKLVYVSSLLVNGSHDF